MRLRQNHRNCFFSNTTNINYFTIFLPTVYVALVIFKNVFLEYKRKKKNSCMEAEGWAILVQVQSSRAVSTDYRQLRL